MMTQYFENNLTEENDVEVSDKGQYIVLSLIGDYTETVILEPWAARAVARALENAAQVADNETSA